MQDDHDDGQALVCRTHGCVRLRRLVPGASVDQLWDAMTQPATLEQWLGRVEGELGAGAAFAVWHDSETRSEHSVTRWQHGQLLGCTWSFPGEPSSDVLFALHAAAGGAVVEVQHEGLADPVAYAAGWDRHLDFLTAAVDGVDLSGVDFWEGHAARVERHAGRAAAPPACAGERRRSGQP